MKDEIINKFKESLNKSSFDAILVFGYDNIQYLSGAYLHYPQSFPDRFMALFCSKNEDPVCILPHIWETSFLNLSWLNKTRAYQEKPGNPNIITETITHLANNSIRKSGNIGIDTERMPLALHHSLENTLSDFKLIPCNNWLKNLRIVKTPKELELLEDVALRTDHTLTGEAHHILVTSVGTEMGISENIRIHAIERQLDEVGHHSIAQATTGPHTQKFWPLAPRYGVGYDRKGKKNEFMRMELNTSYNGYWSTGARMLVLGEPTEAQKTAYQELVTLRNTAQEHLKPKAKANDVYQAVLETAKEKGIQLLNELSIGYGVGVTTHEAPYISAADDTELVPGMIIVLSPIVIGPQEELLMGKDTFIITEEGNKLVGWYKDWREPFLANYTY
jgi:Xaa-Pro dipeptidase